EPHRRARKVDETLFILEQAATGLAPLGGGARAGEVLDAVPPQLGHPVEILRRTAVTTQRLTEGRRHRVHLHVALEPEGARELADQGAVGLQPVVLELLAREVGQAAEAEDELDHDAAASRLRRKQCVWPIGQSSARAKTS